MLFEVQSQSVPASCRVYSSFCMDFHGGKPTSDKYE